MTGLLEEGRAVDVVYWDFSRAFDTVPQKILTEKLLMYGLNDLDGAEHTLRKSADDTKLEGVAEHQQVLRPSRETGTGWRIV